MHHSRLPCEGGYVHAQPVCWWVTKGGHPKRSQYPSQPNRREISIPNSIMGSAMDSIDSSGKRSEGPETLKEALIRPFSSRMGTATQRKPHSCSILSMAYP